MEVRLMYNPFFYTTKLTVDGAVYENKASRLYSYLNMPIEKWIEDSDKSYRSWGGFFVELVEEINEDTIDFIFLSDEKYFNVIAEAFEKQRRGIIQKGFEADEIRISFENIYVVNEFKESLCNFIRRHLKACKMQSYMEKMRFIHQDCQNLNKESNYSELYERIVEVLEYAKSRAVDKKYWEDSIAELNRLYDGKEIKNDYSTGSKETGKGGSKGTTGSVTQFS